MDSPATDADKKRHADQMSESLRSAAPEGSLRFGGIGRVAWPAADGQVFRSFTAILDCPSCNLCVERGASRLAGDLGAVCHRGEAEVTLYRLGHDMRIEDSGKG